VSAGSYSVHLEESASTVQQFERAGYGVLLHIYPLGQQMVFFVAYGNDGVIIMQFMILEIYFQNILKYINENPNNCINKGGKEFKHTSYSYLATSP
jgi:hypothetical protein